MHLVVVGGSDAGISAALRARELAPETDVTVVVADRYPNARADAGLGHVAPCHDPNLTLLHKSGLCRDPTRG